MFLPIKVICDRRPRKDGTCVISIQFTVNYEAAMRLRNVPLNVGRPHLIAYSQKAMFAIEAKGLSAGAGNMTDHKNQSLTGGIPVNFSIACVSYDLYRKVKCKYHDPFNGNIPYENNVLNALTKIITVNCWNF